MSTHTSPGYDLPLLRLQTVSHVNSRITTVTKLGVRVCACVEEREEEVKNESVTEQSQVLVWINIFVGKLEVCVCYRTSENDLWKQV